MGSKTKTKVNTKKRAMKKNNYSTKMGMKKLEKGKANQDHMKLLQQVERLEQYIEVSEVDNLLSEINRIVDKEEYGIMTNEYKIWSLINEYYFKRTKK